VTGFEVYKMYLALKLHFTSNSYDYFQYGGSAKASQRSFDQRKDKFFFVKLSRKFKSLELREFFVANFIAEDKVYPATLVREGAKNYAEYLTRKESLTYRFKEDVSTLYDTHEDFEALFTNGSVHPPLVKALLGGRISIETFTIFNKLFQFIPQFDKTISDEIVWNPLRNKVVKYDPFLTVDLGKYKKIVQSQYL
tara:strand:+ start:174 stop:758 length:585 start_codon:yes stop_codon:yes gene_type:complete